VPAAVKPRALTERQRLFVEAWTGEAKGNGVQAARIAGYKGNDKVLGVAAARLLAEARVQAAIQQATAQVRSVAIATRAERQALLTAMLRDELDEEVVVVVGMGNNMGDHAENVTKRIDARARLKALELLGRMQGDFIDKVEVKTEGALRSQLDRLRKEMSPEAFKELLAGLAKTSA